MILATASLITLHNSCTALIPGVTGHDEESSTIYVDQEAMSENVKEWLSKKGINVVEVDALDEYMSENIDAIHAMLEEAGTGNIPGGPLGDLGWQALLIYLFGRAGIKDSKGIAGALMKKLVAREEKKKKKKVS